MSVSHFLNKNLIFVFIGTLFLTVFSTVTAEDSVSIRVPSDLCPSAGALDLSNECTPIGVWDIGAPSVWQQPGATDGVRLALIDYGFGRHPELVYANYKEGIPSSDHGTHMAGIACAEHNGFGIKGVLPNCHVHTVTAQLPENDVSDQMSNTETRKLAGFVSREQGIQSVVSELQVLIEQDSGVDVFVVPLSYNTDLDSFENADYRLLVQTLIEEQGGAVRKTLYERALARDKVFYVSAGNNPNSADMAKSAKFASPFNWAVDDMMSKGVQPPALIIEAHVPSVDESAVVRLPISNQGELSCPGNETVSTLTNKDPEDLTKAYGLMRGTSQASSHCGAGHLLFKSQRPNYTHMDVLNCFRQLPGVKDETPRLNLTTALSRCQIKNSMQN